MLKQRVTEVKCAERQACVTGQNTVCCSKWGQTVHKRAAVSVGPEQYYASGNYTEEWNKGQHSCSTYVHTMHGMFAAYKRRNAKQPNGTLGHVINLQQKGVELAAYQIERRCWHGGNESCHFVWSESKFASVCSVGNNYLDNFNRMKHEVHIYIHTYIYMRYLKTRFHLSENRVCPLERPKD